MAETLKVVVVGCGGISGSWLRAARNMDDVAVVGLVDRELSAAERQCSAFDLTAAAVGTDMHDMLRQTRPQMVWNLTVPEAHHEISMAALDHGCHVLSEKPLADSMAHARSILDAARRNQRQFAVMQNRRFQAPIRTVADFLGRRSLGRVTTVHCDFFIGARFEGFRRSMRHVLLLDMAIHSFDALRMVAGAQPLAVYCREWNPPGSWYERDASAVAVFDMSDAVVATYRGSWTAQGGNTTWECTWRIYCEHGALLWDGAGNIVIERPRPDSRGLVAETDRESLPVGAFPDLDAGHASCIRHFTDGVRDGRRSETDGEDNLHSLAMVFGAIASATEDRRIVLADLA